MDGFPLEVVIAAEGRRQSYDQMMWQVPGLSLAAQSFLLTIALGANSTPVARLVSGLLAFMAAVATVQLLLKQRYGELQWSMWLERAARGTTFMRMWGHRASKEYAWDHQGHLWDRPAKDQEQIAKANRAPKPSWESPVTGPAKATGRGARRLLAAHSSVNVWTLTLGIFALADLIAAVYGAATLLF